MKDDIIKFWKKKEEQYKKENKIEDYIEASIKSSEKTKEYRGSDYWKKQGIDFFEINEWHKAIECFDKDLQNNEQNFESEYYKALSLYKLGMHFEAIESFNKAWEIQCYLYKKYNSQHKTLSKFKEFEQAIDYTTKVTEIDSTNPDFWLVKGLCLHEISKYDEAIQCFDTALQARPNDSLLFYFKARSELKLGKNDDCLKLLQKAAKNDSAIRKMLQVDTSFTPLKNDLEFTNLLHNKLI